MVGSRLFQAARKGGANGTLGGRSKVAQPVAYRRRRRQQRIEEAGIEPASRLILWLRGNEADTLVSANGTDLDVWRDKSEWINNVAAIGAARPQINTRTMNGLGIVDFDGIDDVMSTVTSIIPSHLDGSGFTDLTVYMAGIVDTVPAGADFAVLLNMGSTVGFGNYRVGWIGGPFRRVRAQSTVGNVETGLGSGYPPLATPFFVKAVLTRFAGSPASTITVDTDLDASGLTGPASPFGTLQLGGVSFFVDMGLAELRVYDDIVPTAEDTAVRAEFAALWGITT